MNALIDAHNRFYPAESRLPMDPRTRNYALVGGEDYRRRPLDAAWALEQFPAPALEPDVCSSGSPAARDRTRTLIVASVTAQRNEQRRYGAASPSRSASPPPSVGPTSAPAAQAVFMTPNASPCASAAISARSDTSAIPGV